MVKFIDSLCAVIKASEISLQTISAKTGISKSTIQEILSGKNDNPRLSTIIDILSVSGGELVIQTEQSKQAIADQDVSWYREEISKREAQIERLQAEIDEVKARLRKRNNTLDELIHKFVLGENNG